MSNFSYEVVESYAEKESLKVKAIAYNGREAKFDIRHWNSKDGEETMGKGVTLTLEELIWLAQELPNVTKKIMGEESDNNSSNNDSEDDTQEEPEVQEEVNNKAVEFMQYVVQSAKEKEPNNKGLHGVIDADGMSYASNNEIILKLNTSIDDIGQVSDNPKLRSVVGLVEKAAMKGLNIGEINKFKAAYKTIGDKKGEFFYSFGKGKPTINARYLGKSLEVLGGNKIKYNDKGLISVISDIGTSIIQPMSNEIEDIGLIEV